MRIAHSIQNAIVVWTTNAFKEMFHFMGKNLSRLYTHNKILISLKTIFSLTLHYFICIWHHSISKQLVFRVSNWFYISRAFFIPNCILYLKNILYNSVFRAAQVFLVYIKTNWFIIIRVAQGFRVVQYFLDFSETQCCSKPCSLNPCSSRTHCSNRPKIVTISIKEGYLVGTYNVAKDFLATQIR